MEEVARLTVKSEDDSQERSTLDKKLRATENRVSDLGGRTEQSQPNRKLKRDLQEELQKINNELMTSVDNTNVL